MQASLDLTVESESLIRSPGLGQAALPVTAADGCMGTDQEERVSDFVWKNPDCMTSVST